MIIFLQDGYYCLCVLVQQDLFCTDTTGLNKCFCAFPSHTHIHTHRYTLIQWLSGCLRVLLLTVNSYSLSVRGREQREQWTLSLDHWHRQKKKNKWRRRHCKCFKNNVFIFHFLLFSGLPWSFETCVCVWKDHVHTWKCVCVSMFTRQKDMALQQRR